MIVYKAEIEAGLQDKLTVASTSALCVLKDEIPEITRNKLDNGLREKIERAFGASQDQFDLFPVYTILVSTGWNKNDDVFGKIPTWEARYTPEDKPFNLEHEPSKIIGHITASCAVDDTLLPIDEDTIVDDLPSKYHILTSAVIYKPANNRNPEWTEATNKLIDEIKDGKWCVSMECLFNDFDYAMAEEDGRHTIVNRNESTAFLTKHLRMYGGQGSFQNRKLGRYLKNITFSGKGLTEKPANPDSVIFTDTSLFNGVFANLNLNDVLSEESGVITNRQLNNEETNMSDEKITLENLQKENEDLKAQVAELSKVSVADIQKQLDELTASLKLKDEELAKASEGVSVKETELTQANEQISVLKSENETLKSAKAELDKEVDGLRVSVTKANRTLNLYAYEIDPLEASSIVDKFISLSDEQFKDMVELIAKKKAGKDKEDKEDKEDMEDDCAEDKNKTDKSGDAEATITDTTSVQDAVASATSTEVEIPAQTITEVNEIQNKIEQAKAGVRDYFSKLLNNKKTNNK